MFPPPTSQQDLQYSVYFTLLWRKNDTCRPRKEVWILRAQQAEKAPLPASLLSGGSQGEDSYQGWQHLFHEELPPAWWSSLWESSPSVPWRSFPGIHGGCAKGPGLPGSVKAPREPPDLGSWRRNFPRAGTNHMSRDSYRDTSSRVTTGCPSPPGCFPVCSLLPPHQMVTNFKDFHSWDDTVVLSDLLLSIPLCFPSTLFYLHSPQYLPFTFSSSC